MAVVVEVFVEPSVRDGDVIGRDLRFEELYARWYQPLVRYCRRQLNGSADAEEVAQEAFLHAWTSWDRYSPSRPFWPWLATIARRLCIDRWRRAERSAPRERLVGAGATRTVPQPDEVLEANEEHRLAAVAFQSLRPAEQRIVGLRDLEGWSYEEIARLEGVTIESVRGSLRRARTRLRERYARIAAGVPAALGAISPGALRRRVTEAAFRALPPLGGLPSAAPWADLVAGVAGVALAVAAASAPAPEIDDRLTSPASPVVAVAAGEPAPGVERRDAPPDDAHGDPAPPPAPAPTPGVELAPRIPVAAPGLDVLPSDGADGPEDASGTRVTASPAYGRDRTLFASGAVRTGCPTHECPALFRSQDGGATWARLPATGFGGGDVLLPPAFPDDGRIFAAGPAGLQVSTDGGATFAVLSPVAGPAAISPRFSAGDPRILVSAAPGWEYRDDLGTTRPFPVPAAGSSTAPSFRFAPAGADHRVFVGTTWAGPAGASSSALSVCDDEGCATPIALGDAVGTPTVALSPRLHDDGAVVAWTPDRLFRSSDAGATFTPVALPAGTVRSVAVAAGGRVLLALGSGADGTGGGLFESAGDGWRRLGAGVVGPVEHVTVLPDGRVLASPEVGDGKGIRCSVDGGATWDMSCPAPAGGD